MITSGKMRCAAILCGAAAIFSTPARAQEPRAADKHEFNLDDLAALRNAAAIAISPDGKTVVLSSVDIGAKGPNKQEWRLVSVAGRRRPKTRSAGTFPPRRIHE